MPLDRLSAPSVALHLATLGYHVIPIITGTKACSIRDWPSLRIQPSEVTAYFDPAADPGIGLLLGTQAAAGCYPAGVDIDINDDKLIESISLAFARPAPVKRGAKGATFICRTPAPIKKRIIRRKDPVTQAQINAVEILAAGQQTVIPPSLHPKGMQYEWTGPSLLDYDPQDLPELTPAVMQEIEWAVKTPDAPVFLLNHMTWAGDKQGGTVHNSVLTAVASLVTHGWSDDDIWARVDRATRRAVASAGDDYDWPTWERQVRKMVEDAREKGFAKRKKQKIHIVVARWIIDEWRGKGRVFYRDGHLAVYHEGWYQQYSPQDLRHAIATEYKEPDEISLIHQDWVTIVNTTFDIAPRFPEKVNHKRVCLKNGTFDLDTMEMLPWSPDDYLISQLDFSYDPRATCPLYERVVERALDDGTEGNPGKAIDCYEEFISHTLFECLDYHKFLVVKGRPRTGKSKLIEIATMLHGKGAVSAVALHNFGDERYRTNMLGKLLNVVGEVQATTHTADDFLKAVTAGDLVQVRYLYQEPIMVRLPTRIMIACNEMFRIRDTSGAIEARMIILSCDNYIERQDRDPKIGVKLRAELPGIFNRMVKGWRRLRDRGQFDEPDSSAIITTDFTSENNHVLQWFKERTHQGMRHSHPDYKIPDNLAMGDNSMLYLDYTEWSKLNGFKQISSVTWGMKLKQLQIHGIAVDVEIKWVGGRAVRVRPIALLNEGRF